MWVNYFRRVATYLTIYCLNKYHRTSTSTNQMLNNERVFLVSCFELRVENLQWRINRFKLKTRKKEKKNFHVSMRHNIFKYEIAIEQHLNVHTTQYKVYYYHHHHKKSSSNQFVEMIYTAIERKRTKLIDLKFLSSYFRFIQVVFGLSCYVLFFLVAFFFHHPLFVATSKWISRYLLQFLILFM